MNRERTEALDRKLFWEFPLSHLKHISLKRGVRTPSAVGKGSGRVIVTHNSGNSVHGRAGKDIPDDGWWTRNDVSTPHQRDTAIGNLDKHVDVRVRPGSNRRPSPRRICGNALPLSYKPINWTWESCISHLPALHVKCCEHLGAVCTNAVLYCPRRFYPKSDRPRAYGKG